MPLSLLVCLHQNLICDNVELDYVFSTEDNRCPGRDEWEDDSYILGRHLKNYKIVNLSANIPRCMAN